ncbi:MAG: hypothetical protein M5U01_06100 [Ardenticatenaceae bacterium]|nr:hypothetical protein [Ardenticatenaceae bacterium]HBY93966.1 hypothetical protein [Chloroflexota bacterium]
MVHVSLWDDAWKQEPLSNEDWHKKGKSREHEWRKWCARLALVPHQSPRHIRATNDWSSASRWWRGWMSCPEESGQTQSRLCILAWIAVKDSEIEVVV